MARLSANNESLIPFLCVSLFCLLCIFTTRHCVCEAADPTYSSHFCTDQTILGVRTNYAPNTPFRSNLNALLSSLSSNATLHDGFYSTSVADGTPDFIRGLFFCRFDVTPTVCQDCVSAAAKDIIQRCPNQTEAIIWYDVCMLRYSNMSFNNIIPSTDVRSDGNVSGSEKQQFDDLLSRMLSSLTGEAVSSRPRKFGAGQENLTSSKSLYVLAQCTPDISDSNCNTCLRAAIGNYPTCCDGREGASIWLPVCSVRYELYPFYNATSILGTPMVPPPRPGRSNISLIVAIVIPIVVTLVLFILGFCLLRRKATRKYNYILEKSASGNDITLIESLQYDLDTIEAATNKFSDENKLGEGGFGVVYKGTLPNGLEIAVKRLSGSSLQGVLEFRNEVALVAKLQHRNLVRLLGFCLEKQEKILIYEYVPNRSLDYFLFDPNKKTELEWSRRYKIIEGIARGILYLHEDSRLTIIHRDLKANNVLLDSDMNPKVSDFGMAKIFVDQIQESTGRIVGTYGYMSPEYAMRGQFSVKSDVFSFGVLVLEIISGKKNTRFYQSNRSDDLLSFAWKHWKDSTPLELLDPSLRGSYSRNEVIRCIHMGLLCVQENPSDRPSMATIVLMLSSHSVTMPLPRKPPSFLRNNIRTANTNQNTMGLESYQSTSTSIPLSINEVSISEIYPR